MKNPKFTREIQSGDFLKKFKISFYKVQKSFKIFFKKSKKVLKKFLKKSLKSF